MNRIVVTSSDKNSIFRREKRLEFEYDSEELLFRYRLASDSQACSWVRAMSRSLDRYAHG